MSDTQGMDNWDKTFKKHEIIEKFPEENGMITIKMYINIESYGKSEILNTICKKNMYIV